MDGKQKAYYSLVCQNGSREMGFAIPLRMIAPRMFVRKQRIFPLLPLVKCDDRPRPNYRYFHRTYGNEVRIMLDPSAFDEDTWLYHSMTSRKLFWPSDKLHLTRVQPELLFDYTKRAFLWTGVASADEMAAMEFELDYALTGRSPDSNPAKLVALIKLVSKTAQPLLFLDTNNMELYNYIFNKKRVGSFLDQIKLKQRFGSFLRNLPNRLVLTSTPGRGFRVNGENDTQDSTLVNFSVDGEY